MYLLNVMEKQSSFFYKAYNPALQAAIIFGAGLLVTAGSKLIQSAGILHVGERFPWLCAAAFLLFFALFNSIFSLSAKDINKYWTRSLLAYAFLVILSGLCAWAFSSISINQAGSYRWIFIVLTFGYLVFLSMMGFMKTIVEYAEKEDWQAPRKPK